MNKWRDMLGKQVIKIRIITKFYSESLKKKYGLNDLGVGWKIKFIEK